MTETFKKKRNLFSTALLISFFLSQEPKEKEVAESKFCDDIIFGEGAKDHSELLENALNDLTEAGYLELKNGEPLRLTNFGRKVALAATSDTPDLNRLARANINAAFACFFAGANALREHIGDQQITQGKNESLIPNLQEIANWIMNKTQSKKK